MRMQKLWSTVAVGNIKNQKARTLDHILYMHFASKKYKGIIAKCYFRSDKSFTPISRRYEGCNCFQNSDLQIKPTLAAQA